MFAWEIVAYLQNSCIISAYVLNNNLNPPIRPWDTPDTIELFVFDPLKLDPFGPGGPFQ
jgi:hypothetical protein